MLSLLFAHAFCFLRGAYARSANSLSTLESYRSWHIGDVLSNHLDVTEANFSSLRFLFFMLVVERKSEKKDKKAEVLNLSAIGGMEVSRRGSEPFGVCGVLPGELYLLSSLRRTGFSKSQ